MRQQQRKQLGLIAEFLRDAGLELSALEKELLAAWGIGALGAFRDRPHSTDKAMRQQQRKQLGLIAELLRDAGLELSALEKELLAAWGIGALGVRALGALVLAHHPHRGSSALIVARNKRSSRL